MVAEHGFLAPRAGEPAPDVGTAVALGAATVSMVGEIGGMAVRSCSRRLRTERWRDGLTPLVLENRPASEPSSPVRVLSFTPPEPQPAAGTVPRTALSAVTPLPLDAADGSRPEAATRPATAPSRRDVEQLVGNGAGPVGPTQFETPPAP